VAKLKVRYVGGMAQALIAGKIVKRGEVIDLPKDIAEELIARGDCEPVKAEKKGGKK
jgi:hypothetical protein